jgi:hypothetical protein
MGKINIVLNNKNYSFEEAVLTSATNDLKQYLATIMSGSGATIELGGRPYSIVL